LQLLAALPHSIDHKASTATQAKEPYGTC